MREVEEVTFVEQSAEAFRYRDAVNRLHRRPQVRILAPGHRLDIRKRRERENLAVEVDTSISGLRVRRVLEAVVIERGRPGGIVVDNGPEFRGRVMEAWSEQRRVPLQFIEPGRPMQNAFVASFNGRLRDECLNSHWFLDLGDASTLSPY